MSAEPRQTPVEFADESVPVHADVGRNHPMVVFGDHRLCSGKSLVVYRMPGPHMHSQVELNFVLEGEMTYWFDGRIVVAPAGHLAMFWGMIPHQVISAPQETRFVGLYAPVSLFLGLPEMSRLRSAIFQGAVIEARRVHSFDRDLFQRWREDLESGDARLESLVRDELTVRVRRLEMEGWRDLRAQAPLEAFKGSSDAKRMAQVEKMTRHIGEHGNGRLDAEDVARASGLHPNYAMQLFRRAVGMTIKQAITRHRLDAAQSMLIASDPSIAMISFNCGFGSPSSFYEAFERRFAASPAHFRKAVIASPMDGAASARVRLATKPHRSARPAGA
jgi:AraC family transcriptional regulator, melibiose operon regulatory protein